VLEHVQEANAYAQEMKKDVRFIAKLHEDVSCKKLEVLIRVDNHENGYYYMWTSAKFEDRLNQMRLLLHRYYEYSEVPDFAKADPFYDPKAPVTFGVGCLSLRMLGNGYENEAEVKILSNEG
jgi:hypothetical protein